MGRSFPKLRPGPMNNSRPYQDGSGIGMIPGTLPEGLISSRLITRLVRHGRDVYEACAPGSPLEGNVLGHIKRRRFIGLGVVTKLMIATV